MVQGVFQRDEHGNGGWQKTALTALWAVLMVVAGWIYADARATQNQQREDIAAIQKQASLDQQRIAISEEAIRQMQRSLDRIESGVEELKRRRP